MNIGDAPDDFPFRPKDFYYPLILLLIYLLSFQCICLICITVTRMGSQICLNLLRGRPAHDFDYSETIAEDENHAANAFTCRSLLL